MVKSVQQEDSGEHCRDSHKNFLRKRAWNPEEDDRLIQLVKQHGPYKWSYIASQMVERVGKQCRERWHNHLNPRIKKEGWTEAEEWNLYLAHQLMGNKWADISKEIMGRTDNSIKNHWNSTMRKKMEGFRQRLLGAIHLLKTAPHKFNKKFGASERNLIKEIVKENCLEKKQPEKKNDRTLLDDLALPGLGLRDFKKLTVDAFHDEEYVDDLSRLTTDNELTFTQMQTLVNFIEENEEEILAVASQKERPEPEKNGVNGTPGSHGFMTPCADSEEFHPQMPVAAFDVNGDDDPLAQANKGLSSSLIVPGFFVNSFNSLAPRKMFEAHVSLFTPQKPEIFQMLKNAQGDNRYNIPSILKPVHDDTAENSSLLSSK